MYYYIDFLLYFSLISRYLFSNEGQKRCGSGWRGGGEKLGRAEGGESNSGYIMWKKNLFFFNKTTTNIKKKEKEVISKLGGKEWDG